MPPDPDTTTPPATVRALAVAPELLASMTGAMADGVVVARDTATGLRALEAKIDGLIKAQSDHVVRVEPAIKAHEDHVRRMLAEDSQATAEARTAARRAETEAAQQRAQMRALIVQIVVAIVSGLLGAGGMAAIGGP